MLARDPAAADLRLSLFVAAARTFKYESLLRPIPVEFETADGQVDIEHILQLVRRLPALPAKPGNTAFLHSSTPSGQKRVSFLFLFLFYFFKNHQGMYKEIVVVELNCFSFRSADTNTKSLSQPPNHATQFENVTQK